LPNEDTAGLWIDGERHDWNRLTFRERKAVSKLIVELEGDPDDPSDDDFLPAVITVIMRRKDPEYPVDKALDMAPEDLVKPPRPTKRAPK
jgi:hypothetical protein